MNNSESSLIRWKKWSVTVLLFLAGYFAYFTTLGEHGFLLDLVNHVGLFLAAVVVVHFIYELMIKRHDREVLKEEITAAINATVESLIPAHQRWGFAGFVEGLDLHRIFDSLEDGDELLWLDTYAPSKYALVEQLISACDRGVKIQVLAISPDSATAKYRSREITQRGFTEQHFINDLREFITTIQDLIKSRHDDRLELRLYEDLPCVPMYVQVRDKTPVAGFTSFFLCRASENFAHMKWTRTEHGLLNSFYEYFKEKWTRANGIHNSHGCAP